jgi:hypothetical protein
MLIPGFSLYHHRGEVSVMNYRLSPSDLTFLYDSCKHCFVLKVKHGISQPSIPLPGVFSVISALQKDFYSDKRTDVVSPELPPGIVKYGELKVRSRDISIPGSSSTCCLSGRFDIVAELDDKTYAVMDFKTGNPNDEKAAMYGRQLHAYAISLEQPGPEALHLAPVSKLGLLFFSPDSCDRPEALKQILAGPMKWIEVPRDDAVFFDFLKQVVELLDGPLPPPDIENCGWCKYRAQTASLAGEPGAGEVSPSASPLCPRCQGPMTRRTGKRGDFWGCNKFPDCRGTRNL